MKDFIFNIKHILHEIRIFPERTITSIHNLIIWFPIIWKDRQWDYRYLFDIMIKKLELMEKFYDNDENTIGADSKIYANDIREARKELQYIADGQNETDALAPLHQAHMDRYGEYTIENVLEDVNREKTQEERDEFTIMVSKCDELYEEHMGNFCRIFKDRVQYWWD